MAARTGSQLSPHSGPRRLLLLRCRLVINNVNYCPDQRVQIWSMPAKTQVDRDVGLDQSDGP
jgi:hypothetical protein